MHINLESDYAVRIVHYLARLERPGFAAKPQNEAEPGDVNRGPADISPDVWVAEPPHPIDAQTISDATCVSLRFTLKIMRKLVAAGLVRSYKGARGGYILARTPSQITLRQVIEAVEGPYRFSRCVDREYDCSCSSPAGCPFHSVFDEVTRMVTEKLDAVTFDQL